MFLPLSNSFQEAYNGRSLRRARIPFLEEHRQFYSWAIAAVRQTEKTITSNIFNISKKFLLDGTIPARKT